MADGKSAKREVWKEAGGPFRIVFDAAPTPTLVVDADVAILALNRAAEVLFGARPEAILGLRGGEALACIHHFESPLGCGHANACRDCVVRDSVDQAMSGAGVNRQLTRMELKKGSEVLNLHMRVTAAPFEVDGSKVVLLALEDVSDLIQLEALLPICAWCKKVRTGEKYWEAVDQFISRKLSVDFSHSICEQCLEKHFPDVEKP